jgi:hypothetical protein
MSYFLGYMSPETDFARQIESVEGELNRKLETLGLGVTIYAVGGKLRVSVRDMDKSGFWRPVVTRNYGTWDEFLSNRESEIDQIVFEATFRC